MAGGSAPEAMALAFTRMHGAGNDFVVLDDRAGRLKPHASALARALCDRRKGLGGNGLILIGAPPAGGSADFTMTYVNAGGDEGEMCGNGARCVARRAMELGIAGPNCSFLTRAGLIRAEVSEAQVRITLSPPGRPEPPVVLDVAGERLEVHAIDTGVPHAVVFVADPDKVDVARLGPALRHHSHFKRGCNANFAAVTQGRLRLRTFERGVEAETLACGTGAAAAALIACHLGKMTPPVTIEARGGELVVDFRKIDGRYADVTLAGPTETIATGEIDTDWLTARGLGEYLGQVATLERRLP
jgi:diaminopimelate epimerase